MSLSKKEIKELADEIAPMIVENVHKSHQSFWIEPEDHYQDHMALREMRKKYTFANQIFWKAFLGLVVLGAITMAVFGLVSWVDVKAMKVLSK